MIAGPFSEWLIQFTASRRHFSPSCIVSTRRLSKHSLLKQRRTGYRPSALTRIVNDEGRTGGAVLKTILLRRKRRRIDRSRCEAVVKKVPPRDRRPIAGTGDRKRSGRRSEIDPQHGLGQPKSLPHFMGRASPAIAATGGGSNGLALILRDRRSAKPPPVAAQTIVEPATLARTTQALRPARPQSGATLSSRVRTRRCRSAPL